jgi:hypothetical protein
VQNSTVWFHRLKDARTRSFIITNSTLRTELVTRQPGYEGPAPRPVPFYGGINRFGARLTGDDGKRMPIFPPLDRHHEEATRHAPGFHIASFAIPLWLLLACYLPLWLGLSYWRSRSKLKRLAAALPEPGAAAV